MTRVFTAVDIENEKVLDELEYIRNTLDMNFNSVTRDKMHITLEFFKDLNQKEIEQLKQHLEQVEIDSFKARIKGIGAFPSNEYIRVVWAGAKSDNFRKLYRKASSHNLSSDNDHEFKPHITLFRVQNLSSKRKRKLKKGMKDHQDYRFGEIEVNSVKIFESRLNGQGSEYKTLKEIKF